MGSKGMIDRFLIQGDSAESLKQRQDARSVQMNHDPPPPPTHTFAWVPKYMKTNLYQA